MGDPRQQPDVWTNRPPSGFYEEAHPTSGMLTAGAVAGGILAGGFIPVGGGRRMWDYYVGGLRAIEEYSPGGVFRTFQASTFFSQFTTQARQGFSVAGTFLRSDAGRGYARYLAQLTGDAPGTHARVLKEGVTFRGGSLYFGQTGDVALRYAGAMISPISDPVLRESESYLGSIAGKHLGSGYARSMGFGTGARFGMAAGDARMFGEELGLATGKFHRQIIGAQTPWGYAGRQLGAIGTEFVSRFNRLLEAPFEMQPFRTVFGGAQDLLYNLTGRRIQLAVPYGSGTQMLGRLAWKYGAVAGGLALGYQSLDYMFREASVFDETVLNQGLTAGLASIWTGANQLASSVAEVTGLHAYREAQERLAPGSTDLSRLLAFPIMGAFGAAGISYAAQVGKMAQLQYAKGIGPAAARTLASEQITKFGTEGLMGRFGRLFGDKAYPFVGKMGPTKLAGLAGAGLGLALIAPFLPGALVPSTRPDELERIYSGQQEVPIRKGRWWEFGRTPWEGNRIMYYRPHWYARMQQRSKEVSIWGDKPPTPLQQWWRQEFTYDLEREFYEERPYPITSLPFEDVPFIGPLLANTIGRLIKPPVLMHTEEWMGPGGEQLAMAPGFGERRAAELGELPPGRAETPFNLTGTAGEQAYRMTEMIGLPGFTISSIKEALTGSADFFDQTMRLESARRAFGTERDYWDLEIGGGLGTTEALRRLYPHRRRQIPLYNPIRNMMPEWLPGPGEKSPDFLHGDPYTKVQEGELRLPGAGYAARFPELQNFKPEDYPDIHRYKILADVAPYSDKYKSMLQSIRSQRKLETWSEYEEGIYKMTEAQLKERKIKRRFAEYEYLSPTGDIDDEGAYYKDESKGVLAELNRIKASEKPEQGVFAKFFGGYWEMLAHNAETSLDVLTPVSPAAKLIHQRTAIEDYENSQIYGTENAFWSHPMRDFIRPFLTKVGESMGFDSIPEHIKERRGLEQYFDVLEYTKQARLSNLARMSGDTAAVKEFEAKKNETLFGLNPFTYNFSHIFRSLPRRERDYFNSFAAADTVEERSKILELVPDNEKALYIARWKLQFKQDVEKAEKAGLLSEDQIAEADIILEQIRDEARSEGFPNNEELFAEYVATKLPGENYGDWYRRTKLLSEVPLPGDDWVGWHPSVDLEDVKLKVVQSMGEDMHDFDLWPSRAQALVNKPFINESAIAPLMNPEQLSPGEMQDRIDELLIPQGARASVFHRNFPGVDIDIEQDVDYDAALDGLV